MQFSYAAVAAALVATVAAHSNITYVTEVHTAYTTYCPEATTLTFNDKTYTITEATTLTITDCPCTVTKPVLVTPVVICKTCPQAPVPTYANSTVPVTPVAPIGSAAPTVSQPPFSAGANRVVVGSAAGLAGLLGLAAYIL
jgi:hypothetical protein